MSLADVALTRMQDGTMPPPSLPAPADSEILPFADWVNNGTPLESCATTGTPPPTGTDPPVPPPTEPNPFDTPVVCTSNQYWTNGNNGSPQMHPGRDCLECHSGNSGAPRFTIAGTVYPTAHEPNECNGVDSATDAVVVITDANGQMVSLAVNDAGNFFLEGGNIAFPFQARVVTPNGERIMGTPQSSGGCNGCHTEQGANGAPGRILLP